MVPLDDPNTLLGITVEDLGEVPARLYHGTGAGQLDTILECGLQPRGSVRDSNWQGDAASHPDFVYLTSTYPGYFASQTDESGLLLFVEVFTDDLDETLLYPDEDFFALQLAKGRDFDAVREDARRMALAEPRRWRDSLATFGNCAHRGTVPPAAMTRYATIDYRKQNAIAFDLLQPSISVANFRLKGDYYRAAVAWVFGDVRAYPAADDLLKTVEAFGGLEGLPDEVVAYNKDQVEFWQARSDDRSGVEVHDLRPR